MLILRPRERPRPCAWLAHRRRLVTAHLGTDGPWLPGRHGPPERHRGGLPGRNLKAPPLRFGEQTPALLSSLSFGLKLAHKFLGCLAGASNRQFKPDVSSCRGPSPLPARAHVCPCSRRSEFTPGGERPAGHTQEPWLRGGCRGVEGSPRPAGTPPSRMGAPPAD